MAITYGEHRAGYEATSKGRYRGKCSCGYESAAYALETAAAGTVFHHIRQVRASYRRSGLSTPEVEPGATLQYGT